MSLPTALLKARNAITKGKKAVNVAETASDVHENGVLNTLGGLVKTKLLIMFGIPFLVFILIVFLLVLSYPQIIAAGIFGDSGSNGGSSSSIDYVQWAIDIANDDSHGYSQCSRTGPDYDCSSLVYYSLLNSGYSEEELGSYPFSTSSEESVLPKIGFTSHTYVESELQAGDILWRNGHTGIYIGDGQTVEAHGPEGGGVCGRQGDQTGDEISVSNNSGNWTRYYRK